MALLLKTSMSGSRDAKGNISKRTSDSILLEVEESDNTVVDNNAPVLAEVTPVVYINSDNATTP